MSIVTGVSGLHPKAAIEFGCSAVFAGVEVRTFIMNGDRIEPALISKPRFCGQEAAECRSWQTACASAEDRARLRAYPSFCDEVSDPSGFGTRGSQLRKSIGSDLIPVDLGRIRNEPVTGKDLGGSVLDVLQLLSSENPDGDTAKSFDFIVIGSGAGGGPVAVNLARAGYHVLVLEAGGSGENKSSQFRYHTPGANARLDPELGWTYWVNSRKNDEDRASQEFHVPGKGLYYPRGTSLGGSTTVNAMISLYPDNDDWNEIADITGDKSWNSLTMRGYFQCVENAGYVDAGMLGEERRSQSGWLSMEQVGSRKNLFKDPDLASYIIKRIRHEEGGAELERAFNSGGEYCPDPNNWNEVCDRKTGIVDPPRSSHLGVRTGTREHLLAAKQDCPDNLTIWTDCLVSKLLFDDVEATRVVGVEFLVGPHLYRAAAFADQFADRPARTVRAHCKREVILSAGAFNSPQLLMLSGIGPKAHLEEMDITCRLDRPGVGSNLQDRLEFGVVCRLPFKPNQYQNCTWGAPGDPCLVEFDTGNPDGEYRSRLKRQFYIVKRTDEKQDKPNAIIFGVVGSFRGYYDPAKSVPSDPNTFTWFTLLGHTRNNAGTVRLRSTDPRDLPAINFNLFEDGSADALGDLDALVAGVKIARRYAAMGEDGPAEWEICPGPGVTTDEQLREYVKRDAWGHHASCSNRIGASDDPMAVVDSRFRVIGAERLRIVDASVFPKIPGLFIALPIYMIAEKASDCIIEDTLQI